MVLQRVKTSTNKESKVTNTNALYGIVISRYECDIIFITWVQGKAKDEGNKNDITQVNGVASILVNQGAVRLVLRGCILNN